MLNPLYFKFYKFNLKADKIISLLDDEMIDDTIINNFFDFLNNISFNTSNRTIFYLRFFFHGSKIKTFPGLLIMSHRAV